MKETVKRFIMSFSYEEKRKRQYEEYQKRKDTLRSMSKEERVFQYIKLNADYEYQKNIFNVLLAASVPLFLNLGFMFWNFMKNVCMYACTLETGGMEVVKIEFVIAAVIVLFVLFLVFMILGQKTKTLKNIRKDQDIICAVSKTKRMKTGTLSTLKKMENRFRKKFLAETRMHWQITRCLHVRMHSSGCVKS